MSNLILFLKDFNPINLRFIQRDDDWGNLSIIHYLLVKGRKEKNTINKLYNYYEDWKAFFVKQQDTIVFDLNAFNTSYEILSTFVHEIGHAVHIKFITPNAQEYSSNISKKYFTESGVKQIQWKTQTSLDVAKSGKQKESGNSERLYLFTK